MSKEFTEPIESWFWPKVIKEPAEETDIDLEEPKIKDVTNEDEEQVNSEDNLHGIRYQNGVFQLTSSTILLQSVTKVYGAYIVILLWTFDLVHLVWLTIAFVKQY